MMSRTFFIVAVPLQQLPQFGVALPGLLMRIPGRMPLCQAEPVLKHPALVGGGCYEPSPVIARNKNPALLKNVTRGALLGL
jgi:hypothetical protein